MNQIKMPKKSSSRPQPKFKRIILKLSGEVLGNPGKGVPIDSDILETLCCELKEIHSLGVEIGLVIGGGNIFRGLSRGKESIVDRTTGDYMGMLATVINGLALMDRLEKMQIETRIQSAIPMSKLAEPYILRRAIRHLEKKRLVIFVAGTGNPYFSTDTTAALRASEIGAQILMKATKVDGIYNKDPARYKNAKKYDNIYFIDALKKRLNIMDLTAFSLCMDNDIPILVFNMTEKGNMKKAIMGKKIGTLVTGG